MADGVKHDGDKNRLDLLPVRALWEVSRVFTSGSGRYGDWNWAQGLKYSRIFGALLRHLFKWILGQSHDPDDGQHHLDSVIWCALVLRHYEYYRTRYEKFDDRQTWEDKEVFETCYKQQ